VSDNPFLKHEQEWEDEHKDDKKPKKKGQEIINNTHVYKDFGEGMRAGIVSPNTRATDLIRSLLEEEDKNRSKFFGHEPIFPLERRVEWEPVYTEPNAGTNEHIQAVQGKVDEVVRDLADKVDERLEYMAMKALTGLDVPFLELPPSIPEGWGISPIEKFVRSEPELVRFSKPVCVEDIKFSERQVTIDVSFAASAFSVAVKKILLKNMRELRIEIDEYIKKLEAEIGVNIGSND
jgi:hypothetical protein